MLRRLGRIALILGVLTLIGAFAVLGAASERPELFPEDSFVQLYVSPHIPLIHGIGVFLSILGALMSDVLGFNLLDLLRQKREDTHNHTATGDPFQFHIITEPDGIYGSMMPGPGLLPDHKIPYQKRVKDRVISDELRTILFRERKILVTGVAGIGKTREVSRLLSNLIDEGYNIFVAKGDAQFDTPLRIPETLRHRLIFVFDDFHQSCSVPPSDSPTESTKPEEYLSSIHALIERLRVRYTPAEVYFIFIARKDIESWRHLMFPSHRLWKDAAEFPVPYPDLECQTSILLSVADKLDLQVSQDVALSLAKANDGTLRNLIQNLYRARRDNTTLTLEKFTPKHGLTWADRYQSILRMYPNEALPAFEAFKVLSELNIARTYSNVLALATLLRFRWLRGKPSKLTAALGVWLFKKPLRKLEADGDLIVNNIDGGYVIHEMLLGVHKLRSDPYTIIPSLWDYLRQTKDLDSWVALAKYSIKNEWHPRLCVEILTLVLRTDNARVTAQLARAMALDQLGEHELALVDATAVCNAEPPLPQAFVFRGILHALAGRKELARKDFDKAATVDPSDIGAYINRATLYRSNDQLQLAEQEITTAISMQPQLASLWIMRSRIRSAQGKQKDARKDLNQALLLQPDDFDVHKVSVEFLLGENKLDEAAMELERLVAKFPEISDVYYLRAYVEYNRRKFENAEQLIDRAIELSPSRKEYYFRRGQIRRKLGKRYLATRDFHRADSSFARNKRDLRRLSSQLQGFLGSDQKLNIPPQALAELEARLETPAGLTDLAKKLRAIGNSKACMLVLNHCIAKFPDNAEAHHLRAHMHEDSGRHQAALTDFDTAIALEPNDYSHLHCRGQLHMRQGRARQALQDLATAWRHEKSSVAVLMPYLTILYGFPERFRRVKESFLSELRKSPDDVVVLLALTKCYALEKDYGSARKLLGRSFDTQFVDARVAVNQLVLGIQTKAIWVTMRWLLRLKPYQHDEILWHLRSHAKDKNPLIELYFETLEILIERPSLRASFAGIQERRLRQPLNSDSLKF